MAEILATGRKNARDIRRAQQAIAAGATSVKLPEDDPVVYGQQIPQQPVQTEPASATSAASVTPAADEPEDNWLDSLTPYQSAPAQAAPVPPQPEASAQQHALTPEEQKANLQALYDSLPETEPVVAKEINELVVAPQIAELKAEKKASLDRAGSEIIRRGISVKLKSGETKHFSLDEHDQLNLFGKLAELTAGAPFCAYHADGEPCTYFLAEDMRAIVQRAVWFVSYHTTYLNALHRWLDVCQDEAELSSIFYGAEVPNKHQNPVLKDLVKQIMGGKA